MTDQKLAAEKNMLIGQEGEWKSEFFSVYPLWE